MPQASVVIQQAGSPRLRIDAVAQECFPTALGPAGTRVLAAACRATCRFQHQPSAQQGWWAEGSTGAPKSDATRPHLALSSISPACPCLAARSDDGLHCCHRDRAVQAFGCGLTERPFHDRRQSHAACATLTAAAVTHLGDGHRCMFQIIKKSVNHFLRCSCPLAADLTMLRTRCQWSAALACGAVKWTGCYEVTGVLKGRKQPDVGLDIVISREQRVTSDCHDNSRIKTPFLKHHPPRLTCPKHRQLLCRLLSSLPP